MKIEDVEIGQKVIAKTSGINSGQCGTVIGIVNSRYTTNTKLVKVQWENGKVLNWHPCHLELKNTKAVGKSAQVASRRIREQIMRDMGLIKVRGALGGTYWE